MVQRFSRVNHRGTKLISEYNVFIYSRLEHRLEAIYYLVRVPLFRFSSCIIPKSEDSSWNYADIKYTEQEGATECTNNSQSAAII